MAESPKVRGKRKDQTVTSPEKEAVVQKKSASKGRPAAGSSKAEIVSGENKTKDAGMKNEEYADNASERVGRLPITRLEIIMLDKELERTGVTVEQLEKRYHFDGITNMSIEIYNKAMKALQATPDLQAA